LVAARIPTLPAAIAILPDPGRFPDARGRNWRSSIRRRAQKTFRTLRPGGHEWRGQYPFRICPATSGKTRQLSRLQ
jgi:hypothetical protein